VGRRKKKSQKEKECARQGKEIVGCTGRGEKGRIKKVRLIYLTKYLTSG